MFDFKSSLVPFCAVCNKDVEKVEWQEDFLMMVIYAKANCHGETEIASMTQEMIMDGEVRKGTAFINNGIENYKSFFPKEDKTIPDFEEFFKENFLELLA